MIIEVVNDNKVKRVSLADKPIVTGKIVIAINGSIFLILVREIKDGPYSFRYMWFKLGVGPSTITDGVIFDDGWSAMKDVLNEGYKVYTFDGVKEMGKFLSKL